MGKYKKLFVWKKFLLPVSCEDIALFISHKKTNATNKHQYERDFIQLHRQQQKKFVSRLWACSTILHEKSGQLHQIVYLCTCLQSCSMMCKKIIDLLSGYENGAAYIGRQQRVKVTYFLCLLTSEKLLLFWTIRGGGHSDKVYNNINKIYNNNKLKISW